MRTRCVGKKGTTGVFIASMFTALLLVIAAGASAQAEPWFERVGNTEQPFAPVPNGGFDTQYTDDVEFDFVTAYMVVMKRGISVEGWNTKDVEFGAGGVHTAFSFHMNNYRWNTETNQEDTSLGKLPHVGNEGFDIIHRIGHSEAGFWIEVGVVEPDVVIDNVYYNKLRIRTSWGMEYTTKGKWPFRQWSGSDGGWHRIEYNVCYAPDSPVPSPDMGKIDLFVNGVCVGLIADINTTPRDEWPLSNTPGYIGYDTISFGMKSEYANVIEPDIEWRIRNIVVEYQLHDWYPDFDLFSLPGGPSIFKPTIPYQAYPDGPFNMREQQQQAWISYYPDIPTNAVFAASNDIYVGGSAFNRQALTALPADEYYAGHFWICEPAGEPDVNAVDVVHKIGSTTGGKWIHFKVIHTEGQPG